MIQDIPRSLVAPSTEGPADRYVFSVSINVLTQGAQHAPSNRCKKTVLQVVAMGVSVVSLNKVLLLVVLMSPVASSMQSNTRHCKGTPGNPREY